MVESKRGTVYLLGAGPGDPELITVRARRRLQEADVVLYDALVHPDLLELCKPGASLEFVGKRAGRASERQSDINARLVEAALVDNGLGFALAVVVAVAAFSGARALRRRDVVAPASSGRPSAGSRSRV